MVEKFCMDRLSSSADLNKQLQDLLADSFVGNTVPVVLFSLHSLLREIEGKVISPEVGSSIVEVFADHGNSFQSAYTALISSSPQQFGSFALTREISLTATEEAAYTNGTFDETIVTAEQISAQENMV